MDIWDYNLLKTVKFGSCGELKFEYDVQPWIGRIYFVGLQPTKTHAELDSSTVFEINNLRVSPVTESVQSSKSIIMLQLKATSFARFLSLYHYQLQYPRSFSDSCKSPIGTWKVFTKFQNDLIQGTAGMRYDRIIVKNRRITSNYETFYV